MDGTSQINQMQRICNQLRSHYVQPKMKHLSLLTITLFGIFTLSSLAQDKKKDDIEKGLLLAYNEYQKENYSSVIAKLRDVIKLVEAKNVERVGEILPEKIEKWIGTDLKREDLSAIGGGVSVIRNYNQESKSISVKLVKDSPLVNHWIKILSNRDLLQATGKKTYPIAGETALVDEPLKVLVAIDEKILLEIKGDNDCETKDLVDFARKLDFASLKKMK